MTCEHGRPGYCRDAATPEQNAAFDGSFRGAYNFLAEHDRAEAERFAAWFAASNYARGDAWAEGVDLRREHEIFRGEGRATALATRRRGARR